MKTILLATAIVITTLGGSFVSAEAASARVEQRIQERRAERPGVRQQKSCRFEETKRRMHGKIIIERTRVCR
jgi:hypothetical protein